MCPNQSYQFDKDHHEFHLIDESKLTSIYETLDLPLSIIVQVTRRCNLSCEFCSESDNFPDPSFNQLESLRDRLIGIERVYLSGGEPLLREDIFRLIDSYKSRFPIVGLPTNCIGITPTVSAKLKGRINYVNAGLDGPRNINNLVRGGYDDILKGLYSLRESGIEVSLSTVLLKETLPGIPFVVQIADNLEIVKVKMVIPVARGRAKRIGANKYANRDDIVQQFENLKKMKMEFGWTPRIKFTFWDESTFGYALLIDPEGKVLAWPVPSMPDGIQVVGDLGSQSIQEIWEKYPYRRNHINKYLGITMNKG